LPVEEKDSGERRSSAPDRDAAVLARTLTTNHAFDREGKSWPLLAVFPQRESNLTSSVPCVQDIFTIRPIAIKYRNGVAASEVFRGSRRGAALRACCAPTSRGAACAFPPIQDLEEEVGFKLLERLPRGVKLSAAGTLFLEDARPILQEVNEAAARGVSDSSHASVVRPTLVRVH
jgi:hypothetical protein